MELIAITGIACKLPGGIDSPSKLWTQLLVGADLVTETPPDRFSIEASYHPDRAAPGHTCSRWGGYVSNPAAFDPAFFGLTPREAARMDPQQRWLLETAWEAFEDAGYPANALAGSGTGVFVGVSSCDYGDIQKRSRYEVDMHNSTGSALSIAANRISYQFDLRGPSLSVDTACSSSLVALNLACQALASGEVPLALVGGANAIFQADIAVAFSKASMLSPTGRCRSFDAAADGFVRAEGAVVIILKPLARALADRDRVYAVIRSTVTNQDGRTGGLTVPSTDQQEALLREAYRRAGIETGLVGFVEAHGTGTPVGDPIEATAIGRALGAGRAAGCPLWLGSVKTNLGHLEPASGLTGLVKLALALRNRTIPPNVHFRKPNPQAPFEQYQLRVPTEAMDWEPIAPNGELYGGVSSFGFGGTNAHAVLSSAPEADRRQSTVASGGPVVWTVSARSRTALEAAARNDAAFIQCTAPTYLLGLAAAAQCRRSHHSHRVAVVADNGVAVVEKLRAFSTGAALQASVFAGHAGPAPLAVVFTGQGTQWPGMARDLFQQLPDFRQTIEELDAVVRPAWGRGLAEELVRGDEALCRSALGQVLLFSLQVGVFRLFAQWGLRPALVLGHSIGEVAAAHVCGALSLNDAVRVIVARSQAQELTRGTGAMAAVGLSEADARALCTARAGRLQVAAFNSPTDVTLAGDESAVRGAVADLLKKGIFAKLLPFPYAFHTSKMDMCRPIFLPMVAGILPRAAEIPFISTVTGVELSGATLGPDYWWRNLREPVAFTTAVHRAADLRVKAFLEIGPHPALLRYVHRTLGAEVAVVPTLRREAHGLTCLAESLAALHTLGTPIAWEAVAGGRPAHADLPRHPWQRQEYWAESDAARHHRTAAPTHPLLGVRDLAPTPRWEACVSVELFPYLRDHGFRGRAVFPAAAHLELMLAAVSDGSFANPIELADLNFKRVLWTDQPHLFQVQYDPLSRRVSIAASQVGKDGPGWQSLSRGVHRGADTVSAEAQNGGFLPPSDAEPVSVDALYARFEQAGHSYGPLFRTVRRAWRKGPDLWAEVALASDLRDEAARYFIHPALLDGILQSMLTAIPVDRERGTIYLPVRMERAEWRRRAGPEVVCRTRNVLIQGARIYADADVFTPDGEQVLKLIGCCCQALPQEAHVTVGGTGLYREAWKPAPREPATVIAPSAWLVIGPSGAASDLTRELSPSGRWVHHETEGADEALLDLLAFKGEGHAVVVIWAAGAAGEAPSVSGVIAALNPVLQVGQHLSATGGAGITLWLVTAGATWGHEGVPSAAPDLSTAPAVGLLRVLANELPSVTCRLLDLDPEGQDHVAIALREIRSLPPEDEIAYRGGRRFAGQALSISPDALGWKALPSSQSAGATYELRTIEPGSLDGLTWVETSPAPLAAHEIEIDVRAIGLNFRDVLKALDVYPLAPDEPRWFGDECTGVVLRVGSGNLGFKPGDEVVAVAPGCFGNRARTAAVLAAQKPAGISFEQAATIPISFLTADYCLSDVARLQAGETVLIHAAAGGVGQAAIQIAHRLGAEVIGTASPEKHELLRGQGVRNVLHSRNLSFAQGVRAVTDGRGVDVVLNSLAGEFLTRSLELLGPFGRFVEIGKKDIFQNAALDLHPFRNGVSFHAVDLHRVIALRPERVGLRLRELMAQFDRGEYVPMPTVKFPCEQVGEAFRLMAQGKHRGKLVVVPDAAAAPAGTLCHERPVVRPDGAYLVTGGLSGLGLRTAEWLAERGARWLILAGRSGASKSDAAQMVVAALAERGVRVEVVACDVADRAAVERLVWAGPPGRPPLRGVVHSAMVLHDEPLGRVLRSSLEEVLAPKVAGAWNLHAATRGLPLDWFVLYSSVATLLGSAGQASYVAANRFLDALAERRLVEGLPALTVNWGPLAEVGVVAENQALGQYLEKLGLGLLAPKMAFRFLDFLLRRAITGAVLAPMDWAKYGEANPQARKSHRLAALLERRPGAASGTDPLAELLARPADERSAALLDYLRRGLASVLKADEATLDPIAPLTTFGVDSLMAFELKLKIDRDLKTNLPVDRLSAGTTLAGLAAVLLPQLIEVPKAAEAVSAAPAPSPSPAIRSVPSATGEQTLRVLRQADAQKLLATLSFDSAALIYLPEQLSTVGGLSEARLRAMFGGDPFVSHLYELEQGRIGLITLPVVVKDLFHSPDSQRMVGEALRLARRKGASCVSLTGLLPSATNYGRAIEAQGVACPITTGHATTTAAVVLNLQSMLLQAGRCLEEEDLAILGLGSIGQSVLRLILAVLPHPRRLSLCDVFSRRENVRAIAREARDQHGYSGPVRVLGSKSGTPEELYEATTILAAVSVPEALDVNLARPGTLIVDDSYPPAFALGKAVRRAEEAGDLFFCNAGMLRLPGLIHEVVLLPAAAESAYDAFGADAFRAEVARDPREMTACVLSSLLTNRHEGFGATVGLAGLDDLVNHYHGLGRLGITAAHPQCGKYAFAPELIRRFRAAFGGTQGPPVIANEEAR